MRIAGGWGMGWPRRGARSSWDEEDRDADVLEDEVVVSEYDCL